VIAPAVGPHDAVHDREPEAGALARALGREERIEDPLLGLGIHAVAGVADRQANVGARGADPEGGGELRVDVTVCSRRDPYRPPAAPMAWAAFWPRLSSTWWICVASALTRPQLGAMSDSIVTLAGTVVRRNWRASSIT
jgi:hypothetical protein